MSISRRALAMLILLLVIALLLSEAFSLLPAEWQGSLGPPSAFFIVGSELQARTSPAPATPAPGTEPLRREFLPFGLHRSSVTDFTVHLASLLILTVSGLLLLYLMPGRLGRIANVLRGSWNRRVRIGLVGLAAWLLIAALGLLAVFTVVGTPIWVAIFLLGYFGALLGLVALSLPLGRWVGYRWGLAEQSPIVDLLAGLLVLFILNLLPFLGGPLLGLAAVLGFGAVLQTRAGSKQPWSFALPDLEY
ncbi:MAG TPA: hypothetical protein VKY74_25295 [Chloroflexia bacterium]|nr:hypothetical protein [Chloroflexia bacterium]